MVLFNEKAMELDVKQCDLMMDIYSHDIHNMLDMYTENCYLEETASTEEERKSSSDGKQTILQTIIAKLKSLIQKISDMIDAFKASIASKKNNLTAEEYMNSETAKIQFAYDVMAIQKEVDEEYLEARKVVQGISKITKVPVDKVAAFCDKMESKLHDNRDKILPTAKAVISTAAIEKTRKSVRDNIMESKNITERSKKLVDDFNKTIGVENDPDAKEKLSVMTRFITVMGKMNKRWMRVSDTLDSEMKRAIKK